MVQFNTKDNEILVKLVFYGPGLSGKTTNLQKLHEMTDPSQKTDLFSVNTMEDRTLFFDLLPVDLGYVYGNSIKLQIYTVPGQVHYDSTRRIVLSGADGVIFVADSEKNKLHENVQSINNLYHNLQANRLNIKEVPLVMQYNKRDLSSALPVEVLNQKLNFRHVPFFEAVAIKGEGVLETFVEAIKQTVRYIFNKYQLSKNMKNVDSVIQKLEESILATSQQAKQVAEQAAQPESVDETFSPRVARGGRTVLKYTHSVKDDDRSSGEKLLQKALTSNMETARLYTDLKNSQSALIKKNEELSILYKQLEKSNADNLKIRRFLESLVNFAGEAIVTFNDLWVVQNWNQAAEEMFHFKREEIVNQNINVLFPQDQMADLNKVLAFVVSGKVVKGFESRLLTKDRSEFPVNITFSPIKNQNDTIIAFTAIIRDLSFLNAIQDQLVKLQRFEPLGYMLPAMVEQLKADTNDQGNLAGAVEALDTLVNAQPQDRDNISLNEIVDSIHAASDLFLAQRGIDWVTQLNPQIEPVRINRSEVTHALFNLLLNAVDSMDGKHPPKITVGTHQTDHEVMLQFIDNGAGTDQKDLQKSVSAISESNGQVGLRITAARKTIRDNGGVIRIDTAPGKGTKVTIKFKRGAV